MADGVDEVGAVQGVEVELANALVYEIHHLLGSDCGRNQMGGRRIVVESVEPTFEPGWHGGTAAGGKAKDLLEIVDRHDAGNDRRPDATRPRRIEKAQIV